MYTVHTRSEMACYQPDSPQISGAQHSQGIQGRNITLSFPAHTQKKNGLWLTQVS